MKNRSLTDSLAELNDVVKGYIQARIRLLQMILLKKSTHVATFLITAIIVVVAALFIALLLSLSFTFWYAENYGTIAEGFLISAGFYLFIALIIYWLRRPLISNTFIKETSELFIDEENTDNEQSDES